MFRLFVGIKIEPTPVILELQSGLKKTLESSKINWVSPENFHLTLNFLGEVEEYYVNSLITILENIASRFGIFTITYDRLGFFGTQIQPNVIWFAFKKHTLLDQLKSSIDEELTELGFKPDRKKFYPHLTLGRVKKYVNTSSFINYINSKNSQLKGEFCVKEFQLIRSILRSNGPEYAVLNAFKLRNELNSLSLHNDQNGIN